MRLRTAAAFALSLAAFGAWPAGAQTPSPDPSPSPSATAVPWGDVQTFTFTACNDSQAPVFVAIAYPEGKSDTAKGWWRIPKAGCTEIGTYPLDHKAFGIYADQREARFAETRAWAGAGQYCISLQSFTYKNAARKGGGICPDTYVMRGFLMVTPEMLFPGDKDRQNEQNLSFKYTFK